MTDQHALKAAGQRRINAIWEFTQAFVAVAVTCATLAVSSTLAIKGEPAAALLLSNSFFLVIGFYFGRTNHSKSGGIGGDKAGDR